MMATATSTSTSSHTRRNLGPLTTTFTAPSYCSNIIQYANCSECDYGWRAQTCTNSAAAPVDDSSCWPPVTADAPDLTAPPAFHGWGFYSPGLACPNNYMSACASTAGQDDGFTFQFRLTSSETAIGCCPTGYNCASFTDGQTCVSVARSTSVLTGTCPGGGSTVSYAYKTLPSAYNNSVMNNFTMLAPLFQLIRQATDLTTTPPGVSTATAISTATSTSSTNTADPDGGAGSHLSAGAAAGIGVGGAAAVFIIALLSYLLWRSRRKPKTNPMESYGPATAQYPQMHEGTYTPATSYVYSELSPQDGSKPQELLNAPIPPAELSAVDAGWARPRSTRSRSPAEIIHGSIDEQKVMGINRRSGQ